MKIDSLAFRTDLIFHRFTGIVFEYPDFIVVKTPTNPTFFWGNLIYFKRPPTTDCLSRWKNLFADHFSSMNVQHLTFSWDSLAGEVGDVQEFISDGFGLEKSSVMVADNIVLPKKINEKIQIKAIVSDEDWARIIDNHVACRSAHFDEGPFRKFAARQVADYRLMVERGRGRWMGAFLDEQLVGDLGIFSENGLARFQCVGTHPSYRRQGICSTLLYHTSKMALEEMNANQIVIVADPLYHASTIYESVGFNTIQTTVGLCKYNKTVWAT